MNSRYLAGNDNLNSHHVFFKLILEL
jgi:hypothetical protein